MSKKDFENKCAVITGATSGICARTAMMMAERGLKALLIIGRNEERAQKVAAACREAGCETYISLCDVGKTEDIQKTLAYIDEVMPKVDILVNGAAISPYDKPWNVETVEHFEWIIDVNLRSQFMFCQAIAKKMVEQRSGSIVNFSSCVARTGSGLSLSYAASKGAIASMTRSLAKVIGPYGVNVNAILPGVIATPMLGDADYTEQAQAWPLRRTGRPEELAEAVMFLASDKSSYMTGTCMDVNGGYVFS